MIKHRLEIDDLEVSSFSLSEPEAQTTVDASDASCYGWCTLIGACPSWFICLPENI